MALPDFFIKAGDDSSTITGILTDDDGDAVDLTGATIAFHMVPIQGGTPVLDEAATNAQTGPSTNVGHVSYTWTAGDTDVPGLYLAEWKVTYSGGREQTFPNGGYILIQISDRLVADA